MPEHTCRNKDELVVGTELVRSVKGIMRQELQITGAAETPPAISIGDLTKLNSSIKFPISKEAFGREEFFIPS